MALSIRIAQLRVVIGVIPPVCGNSSRSSSVARQYGEFSGQFGLQMMEFRQGGFFL
jgi:hypothetical protein